MGTPLSRNPPWLLTTTSTWEVVISQYYFHNHRSMKWWKRVFLAVLDICIVNASLVDNIIRINTQSCLIWMSDLGLIQELLAKSEYIPAKPARLLPPGTSAKSAMQHFPGRNNSGKKHDCVICSTKTKRHQTRTTCKNCNKPMCTYTPCFEKFHS